MNNFNLTDWALRNRAIVLFMLIIVAVAGAFSFTKLGQLEDPNFSVPSMTAGVFWPGATAQQVQDVCKKYFYRKNSTVGVILAEEEEKVAGKTPAAAAPGAGTKKAAAPGGVPAADGGAE